jgi:hypothetical protein
MTDAKHQTQPQQAVTDHMLEAVPMQRRGSGGCWIPAVLGGMVAGILAVIGLALPPVNLVQRLLGVNLFGPTYTMLSAEANAVRSLDGGLTLVVDPADVGQNFGVVINQAANPESAAAAGPGLALQSAVYSMEFTGTAPDTTTVTLPLTAQMGDPDLLDVYAYDAASSQWTFVPSHRAAPDSLTARLDRIPTSLAIFQAAPPDQPAVMLAYDATQVLSTEAGQLATIVSPAGMQPTLDGKLTGSLAPGFQPDAGYLLMPIIRNFTDPRALDTVTVPTILGSSAISRDHAGQLAGFALNNGFAGVFIDYREIPAEQRDAFSGFIAALAGALHQNGLRLGVVVPEALNNNGVWETGAYDWQAIGTAADYVKIDLGLNPLAFTPGPDRPIEAMVRWGVGELSRGKLLLGLSAQSQRQTGESFSPVGYNSALGALGDVSLEADITEGGTLPPGSAISAALDGFAATAGTETVINTPFLDYQGADGSVVSRVWLTTPDALRFRMDSTIPFGLAGVAFDDLLAGDLADGVLQTILDYKLAVPAQANPTDLALRWRVEGAGGVVAEQITGLNEGLVTTLQAPDGNYAINVEVVSGDESSPRSGVAVALFAPTPTPTPLPTPTPTPVPTQRPAVVAAPEQPAAPVAGGAAPIAGGSIQVGSFEYGGHVTNTASEGAAAAMRSAGMNWMKYQIRYSQGNGPDIAAGAIGEAKARGFKILLGIVGIPGELGAGGDGYIQQFAQFLGGVASLGPDAIEVWNEPNIDREWPQGQISGATFARMMQAAHQQIKAANGGVLVISGAPAPTGAEGAFPGRVVNDDRFMRDFVAAGGLNYTDCVGAHYNEGIVGPDDMSGDPRDNYYTRYFFGMVNVYWDIIGGQRPICFTELGYLTPEGFPPLDPFFGWAGDNTLAEQASWLARAAALSSQSGKVRLMIVWNVDFSNYGSDPMAGYAMIRPGGGCPACQAMAASR